MLSRVADNLYWMSRYLERAEHTARLIDVNLNQMLDQNAEDAHQRWRRLRESLRVPTLLAISKEEHNTIPHDDAYSMTEMLIFDTAINASIASCIAGARENARQLRELITTEMWEQVNRLYLQLKSTTMDEIWDTEPHAFLASIKEGVQLFQGLTDSTMSHSEGWHFIRLGRFIERATSVATLLDVHSQTFGSPQEEDSIDTTENVADLIHLDFLGWTGLLRTCASFEAYCKVYTAANIRPTTIVEFLLLNAESPRSIRFAVSMIQIALQSIAKTTGTRHTAVERLAGRLRASLEYDQVEDILLDMHAYLENIQRQCNQIHNAIHQAYVTYPIDVALLSQGAAQA